MISPIAGQALPVSGNRSFGVRRTATHVHRGVDLPAPRGTPVRAVAGGAVVHAVSELTPGFSGYGRAVVVVGLDGLHYLYAHLDEVQVATGQPVLAGQLVGTVGRTCFRREDPGALCGGSHLHFEVSPTPYPQDSEAPRLDPLQLQTPSILIGVIALGCAAGAITYGPQIRARVRRWRH